MKGGSCRHDINNFNSNFNVPAENNNTKNYSQTKREYSNSNNMNKTNNSTNPNNQQINFQKVSFNSLAAVVEEKEPEKKLKISEKVNIP